MRLGQAKKPLTWLPQSVEVGATAPSTEWEINLESESAEGPGYSQGQVPPQFAWFGHQTAQSAPVESRHQPSDFLEFLQFGFQADRSPVVLEQIPIGHAAAHPHRSQIPTDFGER